ncbi:hypothetical protein BS78_10G233400 [Paspalum vaginatum]|nr:hypothetical protein BS78_10G233400 [Paspalum vaginatum]
MAGRQEPAPILMRDTAWPPAGASTARRRPRPVRPSPQLALLLDLRWRGLKHQAREGDLMQFSYVCCCAPTWLLITLYSSTPNKPESFQPLDPAGVMIA